MMMRFYAKLCSEAQRDFRVERRKRNSALFRCCRCADFFSDRNAAALLPESSRVSHAKLQQWSARLRSLGFPGISPKRRHIVKDVRSDFHTTLYKKRWHSRIRDRRHVGRQYERKPKTLDCLQAAAKLNQRRARSRSSFQPSIHRIELCK
ncbi:ARS binding protein Abp2 [Pseudozyma hubeiensis SY62]|uniref:ARS binding protein Abp2 n=1 Tax=Pseudozyma hubeiensis (strain SY62) TaxID=1305764 RepID=R9PF32_PSEHS|nr:ARS binding protein Abp2 [Pseudozyma hubeiensis SY62]GAC99827.1 ARS binding protein Abp2 [Pseudozyma hubeiensis SY62]